jgi:hypothetical protein
MNNNWKRFKKIVVSKSTYCPGIFPERLGKKRKIVIGIAGVPAEI